jgi:serine-type D-Ala-D-Ala carboxypeptidase (penicillin-binding protein 5/6)
VIIMRLPSPLVATAVSALLVLPAVLVATAPAALAEPIGGPLLTGSQVIVEPDPGATPLPDVPVTAWVLADLDTGAILAAKGPHIPRPPASVLKALTALTLVQQLEPDVVYTTTYDDVAVEGSRVGLVENATYTARELFFCLMMQSGNDCASSLANANGGFELSMSQINDEAQRLQAYDTVAINPSGLPAEGQVSSAYDLALIAREGLSRPDFFEYVNTRVIEDFPGYMPEKPGDPRPTMPIATQNPLFIQGYEGAMGVKTGWTTEAGRTFIGAAERDGTSLVVTLLNIEGEIYPSASDLLDWGFSNIDRVTPVGYLVDPIDPNAVEPGMSEVAPIADPTIMNEPTGDNVASGDIISTPWGWVWALVGAMGVGLLLIVLGLRSLRGTASGGGRRARQPGMVQTSEPHYVQR